MSHQSLMRLPPAVTVNQMGNGILRFHYSAASVVALQQALIVFAGSLLETAIAAVQAQKDAELSRQQLPASRLDTIDRELEALTARRAEVVAQIAANPPRSEEEALREAVAAAALVPLPPPVDPLAHPGIAQMPPPIASQPVGVPQYYIPPPAPGPVISGAPPHPVGPTPVQLIPLGG
jgi:hypothetical protein